MSRIELAPEVADDIDRIVEHLHRHEIENLPERIDTIISAIDVLERNPQIGRTTSSDMRELVIGRRSRGYVALYRYMAEFDIVFVLALRARAGAGCTR